MANRENLSVSFTPHHVKFLADCVASGRWQTKSEVIREAVRLLEEREQRAAEQLAFLRAEIAAGEKDFAEGRSTTLETKEDIEQLFDELRESRKKLLNASDTI